MGKNRKNTKTYKKMQKLITHYNFLDINLIKEIEKYVKQSIRSPIWRTSHGWPLAVRLSTNPVAILELPDQFTNVIHKRLKKTGLTWKKDNPPQRSQFYIYPPGGSIAWHDDGLYDFASIIFINPIWNLDWGGLFLYEDLKGLGIRAEIPEFNKCLINSGGVPHGVSLTSAHAPRRYVIITFGPKVQGENKSEHMIKQWETWSKKRNMVKPEE
jgi:hypothetical protein